jgi:2-C-methyl-D-erythritol 4-phosphate cytidylyltransferase
MRGAFQLRSAELVVVAPVGASIEVRSALAEQGLMGGISIVEGSSTLDGSLHNALRHVDEMLRRIELTPGPNYLSSGKESPRDSTERAGKVDPVIVVHDASRPMASAKLIERVISASLDNAGRPAVPTLAMTETVKRVDHSGKIMETIPRESVVRVQMPQACGLSRLTQVHAACAPDFRDGLSLVGVGEDTVLVSGDELAMPVTTAKERELASALRRRRSLRSSEQS